MGECYKLYLWKPCRNKPGLYFPVLRYISTEDYFGNLRNNLLLCIVNYTIQTHPGLSFYSLWRSQWPVEKKLFLFTLGLWELLSDTSSTHIHTIKWVRLKIQTLLESKNISQDIQSSALLYNLLSSSFLKELHDLSNELLQHILNIIF